MAKRPTKKHWWQRSKKEHHAPPPKPVPSDPTEEDWAALAGDFASIGSDIASCLPSAKTVDWGDGATATPLADIRAMRDEMDSKIPTFERKMAGGLVDGIAEAMRAMGVSAQEAAKEIGNLFKSGMIDVKSMGRLNELLGLPPVNEQTPDSFFVPPELHLAPHEVRWESHGTMAGVVETLYTLRLEAQPDTFRLAHGDIISFNTPEGSEVGRVMEVEKNVHSRGTMELRVTVRPLTEVERGGLRKPAQQPVEPQESPFMEELERLSRESEVSADGDG